MNNNFKLIKIIHDYSSESILLIAKFLEHLELDNIMVTSLTKKNIQKLDKMHTKIMQNTKFVYILYIKIAQIKISYNNECTKNIQSAN